MLTATDVDIATEIFTGKFVGVLDVHAPWVIFQKRKYFSPWITKETKELLELRDRWKDKSEALSKLSPNSIEQAEAWSTFKMYRNKINNTKFFEES